MEEMAGSLTKPQAKVLDFAQSNAVREVPKEDSRRETGLFGAALDMVLFSLNKRGLVDEAGRATASGREALKRYYEAIG